MKLLHYILREFKNLAEFYLIPLLAIILPHKVYYPIYKFICTYTFFYAVYSKDSSQNIKKISSDLKTTKLCERNVKILHLFDIVDCWMCLLRPKKALNLQKKIGNWTHREGFLALSIHWGTGFNSLLDLKVSGYNPFFVFSDPPISFAFQSLLERLYRKIRKYYVNKISGSTAISTGSGGYQTIKSSVKNKGVPVILFDAPRDKSQSKYSLNLFDYQYPIASGFINLICSEKIPFQFFSVKLNFETGYRELRVEENIVSSSETELINVMSSYMERLLIESPDHWYFWRQSQSLFIRRQLT